MIKLTCFVQSFWMFLIQNKIGVLDEDSVSFFVLCKKCDLQGIGIVFLPRTVGCLSIKVRLGCGIRSIETIFIVESRRSIEASTWGEVNGSNQVLRFKVSDVDI